MECVLRCSKSTEILSSAFVPKVVETTAVIIKIERMLKFICFTWDLAVSRSQVKQMNFSIRSILIITAVVSTTFGTKAEDKISVLLEHLRTHSIDQGTLYA